MSYSFEARFSPLGVDYSDVFKQLGATLPQLGISYCGEIVELKSHFGAPTIASLNRVLVDKVQSIAEVAKDWWGVSFLGVSRKLLETLGRTDSVEVYLEVFRTPRSLQRMLIYRESSTACFTRASSEQLSQDLSTILVQLCVALSADLVIYEEEMNDDEFSVPSVEEVCSKLDTIHASTLSPATFMAVSRKLMSYADAKARAGRRWAHRIRETTSGYVVFPFLSN